MGPIQSVPTGRNIAVIGAGSWGTAVGHLLADAGHRVTVWGRDRDVVDAIEARHENPRYLAGHPLSPTLRASTELGPVLDAAEVVVCSIPTQKVREVFAPHRSRLAGKLVINTSKGIEIGTDLRVSEIFAELTPGSPYAVLSGPSFAQEVVARLPTAVTIASTDPDRAAEAQKLVATPYFRAYSSHDVIGVELAGALKNVIAVASGMVSGLKLGYNTQAALINRGIAEIARMGRRLGAEPLTFLGLAGTGDLILTCTGPLSRNRRIGTLLGEGKKVEEVRDLIGGVAEGIFTARSARDLAAKHGIEMPITEQVYRILYEGVSPKDALAALMARDLKHELELE